MPKTKTKVDYGNIKVPRPLWNRIEKLIQEHEEDFGYRNPTEFGIAVIRNKLEEYERKYDPPLEEKYKDMFRKLVSNLPNNP